MVDTGKYEGWPVVFGSLEQLQSINKDGLKCFVWQDEGEFKSDKFVFNKDHKEFEPLMIDIVTANMLLTVYNALESKDKFSKMVAGNRATFAILVEFGWKHTRPA